MVLLLQPKSIKALVDMKLEAKRDLALTYYHSIGRVSYTRIEDPKLKTLPHRSVPIYGHENLSERKAWH